MLICARTPLRVSFFGGGTDYPEYFERRHGAVVGMAINKYVYVSALRLSDLIDYKYRVSYSRLETAQRVEDIQHPVVRAILQKYNLPYGLDISISADLPARSGLGSSSAFTVGMLNLVLALTGAKTTRHDLGKLAIHVERELLKERVGVQDQLHASFGGVNRFDFDANRYRISPVQMTGACLDALNRSMYLVYTGINRWASHLLDEQMKSTTEKKLDNDLEHMLKLVDVATDVLEGSDPEKMLKDLGALLHEGWLTKKRLSSKVTTSEIDEAYDAALAAGAIGGKLCGAGGGGFLLMLVPQQRQAGFEERMRGAAPIRIGMDTQGSTIIL